MLVPVLVLGAGAGAVSWLCTWWCCELAGRVVETGCRCWVLVVRVVETAGAGAAGAGCCDLAVRVVETGCRCVKAVHVVERGCRVLVLGAGYRCWVLVLGAVSWRAGARYWCPLLTVK